MAEKKKIAILGGGMASLSTAYALTNESGWEEKYEITLYQLGWRLGGKTTTGRGPHDRIEEHGIHILQGWYDTTFTLLRAVFDERKKKGLDPNVWFGNVERVASERIGRETVTYVSNIYKYYIAYRLMSEQRDRRAAAKEEVKAGR